MFKVHGSHLRYAAAADDPGQRHPWGLGSDATAVTPSSPFATLWWAVTGKMIWGKQVLRQTISREEALVAHTAPMLPFSSRREICACARQVR